MVGPAELGFSWCWDRVQFDAGVFEDLGLAKLRPGKWCTGRRCSRRGAGRGWRRSYRGLLGHLGPGRARAGGRLVRQPRLLPESLPANDVDAFVATLRTHQDRAMVLAMLLGGLRSAEVRDSLLADVDMCRRRLRVIGKGGKERHVPSMQNSSLKSRRICGGSALRTGSTAVFRGAARPDDRCTGQLGWAAQPVSPPPGTLRRDAGASASAAPYLRHRISLGRN